jgi:hypothetical protein
MDAMKTETMDKGFEDMTEEEKRQEIIRLRDECLDEVAAAQRVMAGYAAQANRYAKMLQEMDGKGVKPDGQKADITIDDGDDWDWG